MTDFQCSSQHRLILSCPDQIGVVAQVTSLIAQNGGWITESSQHADIEAGWFFMRTEFKSPSPSAYDNLHAALSALAEDLAMKWSLVDTSARKRVVILASKESHCLSDLLHRWDSGELNCDIAAVISNHNTLSKLVGWYNIPFNHVPADDKTSHFEIIDDLLTVYQTDVTVLARYMQVLPESMCSKRSGSLINIHHSFLPSFVGANPYHQAFTRGVKLIGATCHYVTKNLDQGPIIEQDVVRVTHAHTKDDLVTLGKDVESRVLARGLRCHLDGRVMVHGNKTIVF